MRRTWLLLLIAIAIALLVLLFIAWSSGRLSLGRAANRSPAAATNLPSATAVSRQESSSESSSVVADCLLTPIRYADLGFQTAGQVAEILVEQGEQVASGQVLARLGNRSSLASALADAQNELLIAEQNLQSLYDGALLASAEAFQRLRDAPFSVEDAEDHLENMIDDDADDDVIAQAEARLALARARQVDAQQRYDILKNGPDPVEVARRESSVAVARAHLAAAEDALANLELRSPFAGVASDLAVTVGEYVVPGQSVVLLVDQSQWQVKTTDLTEFSVVRIQPGDPAVVTFDVLPDLKLAGVVKQIPDQGIDRGGEVNYDVLIAVDSLDPRLLWNMSCSARIEPGE
jgi:multidrug efflux pump subunit AcrA (membrane-fusion protein)